MTTGIPGLRPGRMEEAISVEDMRAYELNGVYLGVPLLLMMENAGRSVADYVEYRLGGVKGRKIIVFAGKGGNGGDGFVAARHLAARGAIVEVHLAYPPGEVEHPDARLNLEALQRLDSVRLVKPFAKGWLETKSADAVIDALLGTGVKGALRGSIREAAKAYNEAGGLRVSVDVPTGVDPDTGNAVEGAVRSDATVTMHKPKKGLFQARHYTGEIIVAEIGLPRDAEVIAGPGDVAERIPGRPRDAHKGSAGRLLVVSGSKYYVGAPLLASMAAASVGVDLVFLASTREIAFEAASQCSTIVPRPFRGEALASADLQELSGILDKVHGVLVGPGLGDEQETLEAVVSLVRDAVEKKIPVVVDADGLKAIAKTSGELGGLVVLTPHRGEARRLAGVSEGGGHSDWRRLAREIAKKYNAVVLLKGPTDYICDAKGRCRENRSGVPAMSVGGTGDVLSGLVAGIMAKRKALGKEPDPLNSAATGAFLNGRAGELAYNDLGESLTARDLLSYIPVLLRDPLTGVEQA